MIIVDELDRAKPSYAIRFLETIKHLFGQSQVIFVVGCDRSILVSSAMHEYGALLPTDGYLRRLFDYWIDLPSPNPKQYVLQCADRLGLIKENVLTPRGSIVDDVGAYADLLLLGRRVDEVSLRVIEQSVAHAGVILRLSLVDKQAGLIGWLQGLRLFAPDLHSLYVSNKKISEIYEGLQKYDAFNSANDYFQAWILIWAWNDKEPLNSDTARKLVGTGPTYARILEISPRIDFDERESSASRTDFRIRTVTPHL